MLSLAPVWCNPLGPIIPPYGRMVSLTWVRTSLYQSGIFLIANRCGIHVRDINTCLSNVPGERLFGCDFGSVMKGHALDAQHECQIHVTL